MSADDTARLAEWAALADAATAGPWTWAADAGHRIRVRARLEPDVLGCGALDGPTDADAALIAAAREAVPALIAMVRERDEEIADCEAIIAMVRERDEEIAETLRDKVRDQMRDRECFSDNTSEAIADTVMNVVQPEIDRLTAAQSIAVGALDDAVRDWSLLPTERVILTHLRDMLADAAQVPTSRPITPAPVPVDHPTDSVPADGQQDDRVERAARAWHAAYYPGLDYSKGFLDMARPAARAILAVVDVALGTDGEGRDDSHRMRGDVGPYSTCDGSGHEFLMHHDGTETTWACARCHGTGAQEVGDR